MSEAGESNSSNAPRAVKDVPAEVFIQAYAAHLKTNDKVQLTGPLTQHLRGMWHGLQVVKRSCEAHPDMQQPNMTYCEIWTAGNNLVSTL